MKRKPLTSILVLELTRDRLAGVEMRRRAGNVEEPRFVDAALSIDVFNAEAELAGRELRTHLDAAGIRTRACVLSLPVEMALVHHVDLDGVPENDIESLLSLEAERAFPFVPEDLVLSMSRRVDAEGRARGLLAAVPVNSLDPVIAALRHAGLKPVHCVPAATALLDRKNPRVNAALLVDANGLQFAVAGHGGLVLLRAFTLGEAGGRGAGEDEEDATDDLRRELRLTLRRLAPETRAELERVRVFCNKQGASCLSELLAAELADVGLKVAHSGVDSTGRFVETAEASVAFPALTSLAARTLRGEAPALEFWRPLETRWRSSLRRLLARGALMRLGMAAGIVVVCLLGAIAWQVWRVGSLERRWSTIEPEVRRLETVQDSLRARRPWLDSEPARLELLRSLTEAFPESGEVWVRTVEIRANGRVECLGFARANRDYLATLETLRATPGVRNIQVAQVRGGSPIQFNFNYIWEPGGGR